MKNILVGVTGGISAYKSANIVSMLKKRGYNVKVIMTKNATNIIGPITLETLSKNRVYVDMWDNKGHYEVEHISLAEWADVCLIAPATYNFIGKLVNGIADDMLTTVIAATKAKVFIALAMNVNMIENPILKNNVDKLKEYGYNIIDSDEGVLACDSIGKGRLKNEDKIVDEIDRYFLYENIIGDLKNKKVLITASRTKEDIDPVRYISNNSSGKMGYSLAKAAIDVGADVFLISGPSNLEKPDNLIGFKQVISAEDMYKEVSERFKDCDIFISCAAVADYRPKLYSKNKIKKKDGNLFIELERNHDILFEMGKKKENQVLVGFAAETENVIENAIKKLKNKNLDIIVANNAIAMNSEENQVVILKKDGSFLNVDNNLKEKIAYSIIQEIINLFS